MVAATWLFSAPVVFASQGDVWTVGGGGLLEAKGGFQIQTGDGGPGVQATMISPWGLAVDQAGTILVADVSANTVREIFADGSIDTLAGTTQGFSGDGGPASKAQLSGPRDVDVDPTGGVIIADTQNNRLRKVWPNGSITTIAGGFSPSGPNGDGGPLQGAYLNQPTGVAFARNGVMFIRESSEVRRVDLAGMITTFASGFTSSGDLGVDSIGNVYVPDGTVVWRVDTSGQKSIFAGQNGGGSALDGIAATGAALAGAYHVAVAANDDVYIADSDSGRVRRVSAGIITTIAGGGTSADATGCRPATRAAYVAGQGLALDLHGDLVVARGDLVRRIALTDRACPSITPVVPKRVLETRAADGQLGYSGAHPTPGQLVVLNLKGVESPIPVGATAVVLNLTVTDSSNGGYVTAWACEAARPTTSNINVSAGQTAANAVLVTLGPSNGVCLFDQAGGDLIVDVTGYIGAAVPYLALVPYRALETRPDVGQWHYNGAKPVAGQIVRVPITGWGYGTNSVSPFASAVVLNVTATDATIDGYVTVWSCIGPPPTASNLNVVRGGTVARLVIAQLGLNPAYPFATQKDICLFTQAGTHLIVDILGAFLPESPFSAITPARLLETRADYGQVGYHGNEPVAGKVVEVDVLGSVSANVPSTARAVVLNVTATNPEAPGFITVWPCGVTRPLSSSLNLAAGETASNAVVVGLGTNGKVCIFTQGGADLIADLNGFFA
jgi:hypothetical protein